jgi:hypothetical protein
VSAEDKGRYKVRLESNSGDVKWAFVDVNVIQTGISNFRDYNWIESLFLTELHRITIFETLSAYCAAF